MPPPTKEKTYSLPSRSITTAADLQRHALAKLLADPDKPVHIPAPPPEGVRKLRDPRETMKNVQGSSAGAGSGEFHVYKQSRRREYERLKLMDEEEEYVRLLVGCPFAAFEAHVRVRRLQEKTKNDAMQRHITYETTAEQRTAKNRLKRQRKKAGRKGGKKAAGEDESEEEEVKDDADKKRKLGGSGMVFRKPGEREDEDEDEAGPVPVPEVQPVVEKVVEVAPAVEAGIQIKDDDYDL
ncbi:PRKR-interacting protein 1, partial [Phenoliferia sp. Uapishka_3]